MITGTLINPLGGAEEEEKVSKIFACGFLTGFFSPRSENATHRNARTPCPEFPYRVSDRSAMRVDDEIRIFLVVTGDMAIRNA